MIRYATTDALADYSPALVHPDDVDRYLRAASRLVTRATRLAQYATQPSGLPQDEDLTAALSDAVCEQVTAWTLAGVDPDTGLIIEATEQTVKSVTLGPRSVEYVAGTAAAGTEVPAIDRLTVAAFDILSDAGLISSRVVGVRGW